MYNSMDVNNTGFSSFEDRQDGVFYCYIHWLSTVERRRSCGCAEHRLPAACGQVSVGGM